MIIKASKEKARSLTYVSNFWRIYAIAYIVHHMYICTHSPWTVTSVVAFTVDEGVSVVDWQVYCPPCDVCRGLNERVRVVVELVVL